MRRGDPSALSAAEAALSAGRILDARQLYVEWRRGSSRQRTPVERARAFLLAANLHLIAGKTRKAERCISALERNAGGSMALPLRAQLSLLNGDFREAKRLMNAAVESTRHEADSALRAALIRQRGLTSLGAGDIAAGQADLVEAAKMARIAGDDETLAGAKLDLAESALALGDTGTASALIEQAGKLGGEAALRCRGLLPISEPERGNEDRRRAPATLSEAELLLTEALRAASSGDVTEACGRLGEVKSTGWCEAVESFAGTAGMINALALLKSGRQTEAVKTVNSADRRLSPGARRRFNQAFLWIRMTAALDSGDRVAGLRHGRRLLRELETRRASIFALEQLRRISGDHSQIYRLLIELELQAGDAIKAFEVLQQFSARALLRRSGAASLGVAMRTIEDSPDLAGEPDPGKWALRRILLRGISSGMKSLGWRQAISVLNRLGSD